MTSRIVVVTDSHNLRLGLSRSEHEIVDIRPEMFEQWIGENDSFDAFVGGVDDAADATRLVRLVRAHHPGIPVLLVGGRSADWSTAGDLGLDDISVINLPVTGTALVEAADSLVRASPSVRAQEPPSTTERLSAAEPQADERPTEVEPEPAVLDEPRLVEEPVEEPPLLASSSSAMSSEPLSVPEPAVPAEPEPPSERISKPADGADGGRRPALRRRLPGMRAAGSWQSARPDQGSTEPMHPQALSLPAPDPPAAVRERAEASPREPHEPPSVETTVPSAGEPAPVAANSSNGGIASAGEVRHLVTTLLACAGQLQELRGLATTFTEDAAALNFAQAGVLLLPDGDMWTVCGGFGLRPLEWRPSVQADSWLVQTVVGQGRGIIIEDSDIARQRLAGVPLAARRHLVAVPVPEVGGILMLARDSAPFDERTLVGLVELTEKAGRPLMDAFQVRELARALNAFAGLD